MGPKGHLFIVPTGSGGTLRRPFIKALVPSQGLCSLVTSKALPTPSIPEDEVRVSTWESQGNTVSQAVAMVDGWLVTWRTRGQQAERSRRSR